MKIAIDARGIEKNITGVGRYLMNLLNHWQHDAGTTFLLYMKEQIPDIPLLAGPNMKCTVLPLKKQSNALWQHYALPKQLRKDRPDIFFSPSYVLPLVAPCKTAVTLHDIYYEAHPEWVRPVDRVLLRKMSKLSAKKADIIFTVSEFSKREILRLYHVPEKKVVVTLLGVDERFQKFEQNTHKKEIERFRSSYNIHGPFIIFNGSLFSRRHPKEMINAFLRFRKETGELFQFLMTGRDLTYPPENLHNHIASVNEKLNTNALVHVPYLPDKDLAIAYNLASCGLLYISDYEGFGLPALEALACGTPSVCTDSEIGREILGSCAVFVKNNNSSVEIQNAIYSLVKNMDLRHTILKESKKRLAMFDFKKCADSTLQELKKTANV